MGTNYHHSSHSKYLIKLHFVIAVKYRKPLLKEDFKNDLLQIIYDTAKENNYIISTMQSDIDHLHILIDIKPTVSAKEVIHKIKQISTFRIYKKYRSLLKKYFWKNNILWSRGYFVCSTGDVSTKTIKKYINEQG